MIAANLIAVSAALWGAFALKFDSLCEGLEHNPFLYIGLAAASTMIFAGFGLYRAVVRFIGGKVLVSITAGVLGSTLVLWLLGRSIEPRPFPFSVVVIFALIALVWIASTRLVARWHLTPVEKDGHSRRDLRRRRCRRKAVDGDQF